MTDRKHAAPRLDQLPLRAQAAASSCSSSLSSFSALPRSAKIAQLLAQCIIMVEKSCQRGALRYGVKMSLLVSSASHLLIVLARRPFVGEKTATATVGPGTRPQARVRPGCAGSYTPCEFAAKSSPGCCFTGDTHLGCQEPSHTLTPLADGGSSGRDTGA